MNRTWKSLPSLPQSRSWHGCDRIYIGKTRYLIVYGGHNLVGSTFTDKNDILFLNIDQANSQWTTMIGIQLDNSYRFISGGIVRRLTATQCDMMFIEYGQRLHVCSGNYNWTTTTLYPMAANILVPFVAVGMNNFLPCFK